MAWVLTSSTNYLRFKSETDPNEDILVRKSDVSSLQKDDTTLRINREVEKTVILEYGGVKYSGFPFVSLEAFYTTVLSLL